MFRRLMLALAISGTLTLAALAQDSSDPKDKFDVHSSIGDLHVGSDADAKKIGLPLYPGARPKPDKDSSGDDNNHANLSLFTEAFGFKLVIAGYDSDDAPEKILDFYRDKLKKYGKVLECHTHKHGGNADIDDNDNDKKGKQLQCEGDNTGPVTELKVGIQNDQHVVAVEPHDSGKGSTLTLLYVHARGEKGEI
jgi:hypothetical protein